jgi:hypothetical protein
VMAATAPETAPIAACDPDPALDVALPEVIVLSKRRCCARNWGFAALAAGRPAARAAKRAFCIACLESIVVWMSGLRKQLGILRYVKWDAVEVEARNRSFK